MKINYDDSQIRGLRDRGLSADTYNPVLHKALTEFYMDKSTLGEKPDPNLKDHYEKLEKIVKNCDFKSGEKILNFLESHGGGASFDDAAMNEFKELLS